MIGTQNPLPSKISHDKPAQHGVPTVSQPWSCGMHGDGVGVAVGAGVGDGVGVGVSSGLGVGGGQHTFPPSRS